MPPFRIPNPEQFLPTIPGSQPPLSFSGSLGQSAAQDPTFDRVRQLVSLLETARPPEPPQLKKWQKIVGGLGDAISAMAAVRAGGAPPPIGQFAARQLSDRQRFEEQTRLTEQNRIAARNEIVKLVIAEQLQKEHETEIASIRSRPRALQLKQLDTTDEAGRPIRIPYNYDPNSATLAPVPGFEGGFDKYVRPFLAQGVNTETGELEFKLVDPFMRPAGGGRVTGGGGGTQTVEGIEPKPTAGEAESVEAASVIKQQLANFKRLAMKFSARKRALGTVRALGQGIVRELPGGQAVAETAGDPAFEELAAIRDRIGQQLARLVESGRLSDQDREFAMRNLPTVAALTTEEGKRLAAAKIEIVEEEINTRLARKGRLRPGLVGGGNQSVDEILKQYEETYGAPAAP